MDLIVILYIIGLVLAIVSLFVPPRAFQLLAAAVIVIGIGLVLSAAGVTVS